MTSRLYYEDSFLYDFDAEVLEVLETPRPGLILDRTAFYPTSGGQVFDTGWITSDADPKLRVTEVAEAEDGKVIHYLEAPLKDLKPGTRVRGQIDAQRRRDHMQQHSGQHVLYAATVTSGVDTSGSYSDPSWLSISKTKVGLSAVENTALSTWAGTSNITTVGTLSAGTVPWSLLGSVPSTFTPAGHAASHAGAGGDPITSLGTLTAGFSVVQTGNQLSTIGVQNADATDTGAGSILIANADWGSIATTAHGSGRTAARFGVTLGGYGELATFNGNGLIVGTRTTAPLILGTNALQRMWIDGTTGNVGIGTASPGAPFEVVTNNGTGSTLQATTYDNWAGVSSTRPIRPPPDSIWRTCGEGMPAI